MLFSVQRKKVGVLINKRKKKNRGREEGEWQCMGRTYYLFLYYHCSAVVRAVANNMGCLGIRDMWTWSVIFLMVPNISRMGIHMIGLSCASQTIPRHIPLSKPTNSRQRWQHIYIYIYIYMIFLYLFSVRCLQN